MTNKITTESGDWRFLNQEESRQFFEDAAQRAMGISGSEFLRRYDAGEYDDVIDHPDWHGKLMRLVLLRSFAQ